MKKDKRFLKGALVGALAMFCIIIAGNGLWSAAIAIGLLPALSTESQVKSKLEFLGKMVDRYYLYEDELDEDAMIEGLYAGYLSAIGDPYTVYYNEEETEELFEGVTGEFYGVGAVITTDTETGNIVVTRVNEDSPAEKAGLQADDILLRVDDHVLTDETPEEVVELIKGDQGTEVTLYVMRDGEEVAVTAVRDTVKSETVYSEMKEDQIGYIYIEEFDDVTVEQFEEAFAALEEQGMQGLVIDLRNNPGGNLDTVVEILQMLLPEGDIVSIQNRNGKQKNYTCDGSREFDKPLAVLVNQYSASASEIFSGAIQDYEIGTIVGMTTYGKGVVQDIYSLGDGTSMKITTAEYYLPSGRSINKKGITPDVEVEYEYDEENPAYDNQLEKALEVVREKLS